MTFGKLSNLIRTNTKQHSPTILSVLAGVGTLTTVYLTSKASFAASRLIDEKEANGGGPLLDPKERLMERTKLVWMLYIPTAVATTGTIICIVGANRVGANKTLAAQAALSVSQQVYSDYRDKVIEKFGENKDQAVRDAIAEDRVKKGAPPADIMIAGPGNVLCCELFTGRFFSSDMESLRRAQNDLNDKLLKRDYMTMGDFHYMLGIAQTTISSQLGWKSDKQMELKFSTVLTDDGRPCLAFEYNYTVPM